MKIQEAMKKLPEEQRQVLVLGYFRGFTQAEISKGLNVPLGTVKTRMRLGIQKLRQSLAFMREEADEVWVCPGVDSSVRAWGVES